MFAGGSTVYLVDIAPLEVADPRNILLADKGTPIMGWRAPVRARYSQPAIDGCTTSTLTAMTIGK